MPVDLPEVERRRGHQNVVAEHVGERCPSQDGRAARPDRELLEIIEGGLHAEAECDRVKHVADDRERGGEKGDGSEPWPCGAHREMNYTTAGIIPPAALPPP